MNTAVPFIDLSRLNSPLEADFVSVFRSAIDRSGFIGGGELTSFEEAFALYLGCEFCLGVSNGTDAIKLALLACGVGPGDTVITVPNTFIATAEAVRDTGGEVLFADIDPNTGLMDVAAVEKLLKGRDVKAVIPVHLYGQCVDMEPLMALSREHSFFVIEDSCQAHGAEYHGRKAGSIGHAAAFSFYPTKNLGALGDAGCVATSDADIWKRVLAMRDHGQSSKNEHSLRGFNHRMDALQASFLHRKLHKLDQWNVERKEIATRYDEAFSGLAFANIVGRSSGSSHVYHLYALRTRHRERLAAHLKNCGVPTAIHYPVPIHLQPAFASLALGQESLPNAEAWACEVLSLPMFPGMTNEEIQTVIEAVVSFGDGR